MPKVLSILFNDDLNGVTTMNFTLLKRLTETPHSFECHVLFLSQVDGGFASRFRDASIQIVEDYSDTYDYVIFNNNTGLQDGLRNGVQGSGTAKWMYFVHSLDNVNESIPPLNSRISRFDLTVYTFSQKGEDYLTSLGHTPVQVKNAIDLTRFTTAAAPTEIKKLLVLDVRNAAAYQQKVVDLAPLMPQVYVRMISLPTWDIEEEIAAADMVIALGRSAIEAMAMGKPVIVYGINGGDGLVTDVNKTALADTNFSGYSYRSMPIPEHLFSLSFLTEITKFSQSDAETVRDWIRANYSIDDLATEVATTE